MRKIIHIGMGKTGTTRLQREIFPELDRLGLLNYHYDLSNKVKNINFKRNVLNVASEKKFDLGLGEFSGNSIHLISQEEILSWNPANWKTSIDNLLNDYGEEAEILVTLRSPYSFLRSSYQQQVHEGENDLMPENYFLRSDLHKKHLDYFGKSNNNRRFAIDELNYSYLFDLIFKRFSTLYFSDMKTTLEYQFLVDMNIIDNDLCEKFRLEKSNKISNQAYSKYAVLLNEKRNKILSKIGLMPISSSIMIRKKSEQIILESNQFHKEKLSDTSNLNKKTLISKIKSFSKHFGVVYKLIVFCYKLLMLPYTIIVKWRDFLQNYVNVFLKYEKYELPSEMYLGKHYNQNVDFYKKLPLYKNYKK